MNMRKDLELEASNREISRLRHLIDHLRAQTVIDHKEFKRLMILPERVDPLKVQKLFLKKSRDVKNLIKQKMFYKWRALFKFSHLRRKELNTGELHNWKGFLGVLTELHYHFFMTSMEGEENAKTGNASYIIFKQSEDDLKAVASTFILLLKPFYQE